MKNSNKKSNSREDLKKITGSVIVPNCSNFFCPDDGKPTCPGIYCRDVLCPQV
ncbi:hypothetical protein [Chryseobacterium sp.]|uniref:hypothetical protein n=1 Tax=Chryseobacterium sp. TaxID=1871047 RepID=UPI0028971AF6|nr:hypothetical protein [Chryseobacterium sp.]